MRPLYTDYTIRESARAKHARLRVTLSDGLVVVVPAGFDRRRIPGILREHRAWIERALKRIETHRAAVPLTDCRPETIELPAIGQIWRVDWRKTDALRVSVAVTGPLRLRVSGPVDDRSLCHTALRRWLIERGRERLIPWTEDLARELGVRVRRTSVRCQRTRWGSYSTKGTISLNAQLLFLPEELVRYVLLHELCHVRHPNHSPRFWNLVRRHEPDTERLRKELRAAWKYVPDWIAGAPEPKRDPAHRRNDGPRGER
jgi:predicted metal-dependent hydrolase